MGAARYRWSSARADRRALRRCAGPAAAAVRPGGLLESVRHDRMLLAFVAGIGTPWVSTTCLVVAGAAAGGVGHVGSAATARRWAFQAMATAVFEVGAALLGACVGSFLNVVIWRLPQEDPRKRSLGGRSHCPHCGALIRWFDNIPILGWVALRGRARCCRNRIAIRYPLVEALTAALFLAAALWPLPPFGPAVFATPAGALRIDADAAGAFGFSAILMALLVACTFIDLDHRILPDALTKPGMVLGVAAGFWPGLAGTVSDDPATPEVLRTVLASVLGLLAGAGVTWLIRDLATRIFRREAMGLGDVKFLGMIGAFLGWRAVLLALFLGCVFGAAFGIATMRASSPAARMIPFGPFLALGAVTALFAEGPIVTFLFETWPEWQRSSAAAPWFLSAFALLSLVALIVLVRRGRRQG